MKAKYMIRAVLKLAGCWSVKETELFVEILAESDSGLAQSLECLALKKFSNNKVFGHIQCEFLKGLKSDTFRDINELNFLR